jgi:hypothetical protein
MFQFCSMQPVVEHPQMTVAVDGAGWHIRGGSKWIRNQSKSRRNIVNKSLTCRAALGSRVWHFGDGFLDRSGV